MTKTIGDLVDQLAGVPDPHPYSLLVPEMTKGEYIELAEDIAQNGLQHPVVMYEGLILDGRHRARACAETGMPPHYKEFEGENPVSFVISTNIKRRHLTGSQLAAVAVDAEPAFAKHARKRQEAAGVHGSKGGRPKKDAPKPLSPNGDKGFAKRAKASEESAKAVGASARQMQRAKAVKKADPKLHEQVLSGAVTVGAAEKKIKQRERNKRRVEQPLPTGEYELILADPPWQYAGVTTSEDRRIEQHYETMTLDAIKALKVPAAKDAVLFLWATSPLLPEAMAVMDAWGFAYKTCAVWVKDRIGMGYWFRQQHELLLLGVRGDPPKPDEGVRPSSVINAPRRAHSAKPTEAYELIEGMYPMLTADHRVELFAREARDGWASWGNEA